jgi:hypothetical protein
MSLLIPPLIIVKLIPTFLTMLYVVYLILTSYLLFYNKFLLNFVMFLLLSQTKKHFSLQRNALFLVSLFLRRGSYHARFK